jgi:hypothetical protein
MPNLVLSASSSGNYGVRMDTTVMIAPQSLKQGIVSYKYREYIYILNLTLKNNKSILNIGTGCRSVVRFIPWQL